MDSPMQCPACGAIKLSNWKYQVSGAGKPAYFDAPKMNTRICRYAKERGKRCLNDCEAVVHEEKFETRVAQIDAIMTEFDINAKPCDHWR